MRSTIFKNRRFIIGILAAAAIAVIAGGLSSSSVNARVFGLFGIAAVEQQTNDKKAVDTPGTDAPFTAGNLLATVAAASASNTTVSVIEVNPLVNNPSPLQTILIDGTGTNAIRVSGSATSTLYASRSNDGSLFSFNGVNTTDTTSNVNTLNPRAVVALNSAGTYSSPATTYTGTLSGNPQTRASTTLNNSDWFISDQNGFYTNGASSASPSGNFRNARAFGGTVYAGRASTTAGVTQVFTINLPTGGTITDLAGIPNSGNHQDFYLIQSGSNGSTYDVMYILQATSNTAGTLLKYSLVGGTWTANGTYSTGVGGFGLAARRSGSGGADIWLSTGQGALTANSIRRLIDTTGYNSTINITIPSAPNDIIYTAPTGTIIKGVDFAPASVTLSVLKAGTGTGTVTSSLPGINCGGTCSANYSQDTIVTLTATADPGSTFTGWSGGGCSGTGTCTVTLSSATSVTATFDLSATPPTVTTSAATGITTTAATLNGAANPNGFAATGWFRYSTVNPGTCNDLFGTRAPASGGSPLGSGSSPVGFTENISGLSPGTTYYFCAIANNTGGTGFGSVLSFTTDADPPDVQFAAAAFQDDESQSAVITVTRTGDLSGTSSVNVVITDGTATGAASCTSGIDYVNSSPVSVNFGIGISTQSFNVPLCGDTLNEPLETAQLSLASPVNADIGTPSTAVLNINDTANQWRSTASLTINLGLPASPDYPSDLVVTGAPPSIGAIRVTLYDLYHDFPDNLDVLLVGPNGNKYVLMADAGGPSPGIPSTAPVTLTFSDAPNPVIPDSVPPTTGKYLPTTWETVLPFPLPAPGTPYGIPGNDPFPSRTVANALFGQFGLSDGNGTWRLYIRDDAGTPFAPDTLMGELLGGWGLELLPPTAAGVEVSGRVITPDGRGLRNATVTMTDGQGVTRTAVTSSFGYYRFEGVPVGDSFVMTVNSRSYRFTPRVVQVFDTLTDVDFVGLE